MPASANGTISPKVESRAQRLSRSTGSGWGVASAFLQRPRTSNTIDGMFSATRRRYPLSNRINRSEFKRIAGTAETNPATVSVDGSGPGTLSSQLLRPQLRASEYVHP